MKDLGILPRAHQWFRSPWIQWLAVFCCAATCTACDADARKLV